MLRATTADPTRSETVAVCQYTVLQQISTFPAYWCPLGDITSVGSSLAVTLMTDYPTVIHADSSFYK